MFKKPFSFDGRIGRTEYCLSSLAYITVLAGLQFASLASDIANIVTLLCMIPLIWFMVAQGTKRCHDRNNIGFFQIIPFYGFWMLFAPGDPGENDFGPSPKQSAELPA
jgi:uncharacterized membrane protein YhaH (DUF805 family)